jgi:hypothetical protein
VHKLKFVPIGRGLLELRFPVAGSQVLRTFGLHSERSEAIISPTVEV